MLHPQHLKDLVSKSRDDNEGLLNSLASICNKMLRGDLPNEILPVFYGASLIAFSKPNGGNTLRRLTAKAAAYALKNEVKSKLFPYHLGVCTSGGA